VARIADITSYLLLRISTVFINDFGRYFHTFTGPPAETLADSHGTLAFCKTLVENHRYISTVGRLIVILVYWLMFIFSQDCCNSCGGVFVKCLEGEGLGM